MPPIIFFIALIQVLIHWGVIQWLVGKFATVFFQTMAVSGVEAIVAAASPFIGQGESMMLVKPFIPVLTRAEIHQVMASGFATIAGGVLYAYISMGVNPAALVSSCVMSIPAALAISKLRFPETEETATAGQLVVPEEAEGEKHRNVLHAIASGSGLGIRVAGMVVAGVLCILSLLGLVDGLLGWWGSYFGIVDPSLSVELIGGYLFYPVAFLLGVERNGDLLKVGKLIAMKVIENEFVAVSFFLPCEPPVHTAHVETGDSTARYRTTPSSPTCRRGLAPSPPTPCAGSATWRLWASRSLSSASWHRVGRVTCPRWHCRLWSRAWWRR